MTAASKLFYNWRSRSGRNPDAGPASDDSHLDRDLNLRRSRHGHARRRRQDEGFDPSQRPHPGEFHASRRASQIERETVRPDRCATSEFREGNNSCGVSTSVVSRSRLIRNDRLPDAVLKARARLVERLRGLSLNESRQASTVSGTSWDEFVVSDDFGVDDFREWELGTRRDRSDSNTQNAEFTADERNKKTSGLSWEALYGLQHEVFSISSSNSDMNVLLDCCICLESFSEGDGLIRLQCGHMFHTACLEPWTQTSRDCPYCRANIVC